MDINNIKNLVVALGFAPLDGTRDIYAKQYPRYDSYSIHIDFGNQRIDYLNSNPECNRIYIWDITTCNFLRDENFIVLECVNRLLEKGYAPTCIQLEKRYPLGRREKGKLDIIINLPDGTPYILIECKTWGIEFDKELALMNRNGGQLFSYYANERAAKFICLYASKLDDKILLYKNAIIPIEPEWVALSGTKEIVAAWNGNFKNNGIFEADRAPYNVVHTALTYGELQTITEEHSDKIFDLIMEILRHNVVSDKPNAFNKLLNLFVCKIIDEDREPHEVAEFQLFDNDDKYALQMRLNDLYKKGMLRFLNIRVTDYSQSEINELTAIGDENQRAKLKEVITKLRLQKNPEFAFVEVCDDKTFETNDKILKQIVQLLQGFKFRYAQKHQFLGDFFELLLSTSIKQEAGQFFTPVPITRFIISAMPLKSRVDTNVVMKTDDFLPTVIDYACGSGHFLTEYLEQMQNIVDTADFSKAKPSIKRMVRQYQDEGKFSWADKYVYGIDLDYRLVKTTKVSAFFNGDGEAKIIWANGLGNFEQTPEYLDKLRVVSRVDKRDNATFDILISNPPYSVEAFKSTLNYGAETFEIFDEVSDKSKEIECLFVERMKHLLKSGGWAGVILPSSIMTNGGIHAKAREILFKYFKFKAIAEMGSGTFMKTGTNTVILFLERRDNADWQNVNHAVDKFFADYYSDVTVLGIEQPFSKYASEVRNENLESYIDFIKTASKDIIKIEKDKLLYFILTYSQEIVLIKSGQKQIEKEFLGYEFSERRGREGLRLLTSGGKLFDEKDPLNQTKVSSYIYNAFLGKRSNNIHATVAGHISYERLSSLINYNTSVWNKQVFLLRKTLSAKIGKHGTKKIGEIFETIESGSRPEGGVGNIGRYEGILSIGGEHIDNISGRLNLRSPKYVPKIFFEQASNGKIKKGDILICKDGALTGKTAFVYDEFDNNYAMLNEHVFLLRCSNIISQRFVFFFLHSDFGQVLLRNNITGQAQGGLNSTNLKNISIPFPLSNIQQQIIDECEAVEKEKQPIATSILQYQQDIEQIFLEAQRKASITYNLADKKLFNLNIGSRVLKTEVLSTAQYPVYSANVFEPFGYIDKLLSTKFPDFNIPSVLWGIDGDWMVSYMPENKPFYPTDHCGVLRVIIQSIHPRYLAWLLNKEGMTQEFSRTRRASIDRIKSITLSVPDIIIQQEAVRLVFELEQKIEAARQSLDELDKKHKSILEKYL